MNSRNVNINLTRVKFKNNHVVYENFAKCTIKDYEFNLSYNPTLLSGSQGLLVPYTYTSASYRGSETFYEVTGSEYFGILKDFATGSISGSDFSPYVSTIGLYNDAQELLAVAKMAVPTPISPNTDMTFLVKFDTQWNNKPYFTPTPSPSRTPYPTQEVPSLTPTNTPTVTPTVTPSVTPTISKTPSVTPTISTTPSITPTISKTPSITPTATVSVTPSITPSLTPTPSAGGISINVIDYVYPVTAGYGSSSGTITNTSGVTIYVYLVFNSGGHNSGNINNDSGDVEGNILSMSGTITSYGQYFYSTSYVALANGSTNIGWNLSKQDNLSSGASLRLGYSTTPGGTITLIAE